MTYLYRHVRLDRNEPFYIGIGSDPSYKRANSDKGRNTFWKRIVNKCTEYKIEILLDELTWEEACSKEIEFVKLYGRYDLGKGSLCNLTDGGEGSLGIIPNDNTRQKMISALKRRIVSDNTRKKLSQGKLGINNPMYGKHFSKEHKKNHSEGLKGHVVSEETKRKISEAQKGKSRNSEEMRKHLSEINTGSKHPMYGKTRSEEVRKRISLGHMGKKASQETRLKQSIAAKNRWQKKGEQDANP